MRFSLFIFCEELSQLKFVSSVRKIKNKQKLEKLNLLLVYSDSKKLFYSKAKNVVL